VGCSLKVEGLWQQLVAAAWVIHTPRTHHAPHPTPTTHPRSLKVQLEEGGQLIPVTIKGLSANGYLLVGSCTCAVVVAVLATSASGCFRWLGGRSDALTICLPPNSTAPLAFMRTCLGTQPANLQPGACITDPAILGVLPVFPPCRPVMAQGSGTSCTRMATAWTSSKAWSGRSCLHERYLQCSFVRSKQVTFGPFSPEPVPL